MKDLKLCDMTSGARVPVNWADAPEFVPGSGRVTAPGERNLCTRVHIGTSLLPRKGSNVHCRYLVRNSVSKLTIDDEHVMS